MLTESQRVVWRAIASLPEADPFALAGGGAMISLGLVDRGTNDLDIFGTTVEDFARLASVVVQALNAQGFSAEETFRSATMAKLSVASNGEKVKVDLGFVYPRFATVQLAVGEVISPQDLAADKLLALWNRSAPRDFLDVHALAQRFGLEEMCRLAAEKDLGFRIDLLFLGLVPFVDLARHEFPITDSEYAELDGWVRSTLKELPRSDLFS